MKHADSIVVAGGVPYAVSSVRIDGENWNMFVRRHLQEVAEFCERLGDDVESLETEFT